jgi:hypothetical protein
MQPNGTDDEFPSDIGYGEYTGRAESDGRVSPLKSPDLSPRTEAHLGDVHYDPGMTSAFLERNRSCGKHIGNPGCLRDLMRDVPVC